MSLAPALLALTLALAAPAPAAPAASPSPTASPAQPALPMQPGMPMKGMLMPAAPLPSSVPLDAAARAHLTRATATVEGEIAGTYAGVRLADLVRAAGAPAGDVRGRAAAAYLAVHGSDGYIAIFSLPELDSTVERCAPILADTKDGARIGADVGPLRVVAPCDRHASRSVRNVVALTIGSARTPQR